jgi:hypothetical protein
MGYIDRREFLKLTGGWFGGSLIFSLGCAPLLTGLTKKQKNLLEEAKKLLLDGNFEGDSKAFKLLTELKKTNPKKIIEIDSLVNDYITKFGEKINIQIGVVATDPSYDRRDSGLEEMNRDTIFDYMKVHNSLTQYPLTLEQKLELGREMGSKFRSSHNSIFGKNIETRSFRRAHTRLYQEQADELLQNLEVKEFEGITLDQLTDKKYSNWEILEGSQKYRKTGVPTDGPFSLQAFYGKLD